MKKNILCNVLLCATLCNLTILNARFVEVESMSQFTQEMEKPVILKFFATWCPPCKAIAPVYKEIAENTPDVTFLSVDVDVVPEAARKYKITSIPRIFIVDPSQEVPQKVDISAAAIKKAADDIKQLTKKEPKAEMPKLEVKKAEKKEMTVTIDTPEAYDAQVKCDKNKVVITLNPK